MFFIVNKTKHNVTIGDLDLNLGPRQAIDLDKIMDRSKSNTSKGLKAAKNNGDIEIRIKDESKSHVIPNIKSVQHVQSVDLKGMKDEIIDEMRSTVKELMIGREISKEDLQGITNTLIQALPKQEIITQQEKKSIRQDEEVEMDGNILVDMNKRVVDKMVKNVESVGIKYEEGIKEDDIMNNIEELEGLLG